MPLTEFFQAHPRAALGFSGGVDSAYLLYAGLSAGADLRPYFIKTPFQPAFELADAQRLAAQLGAQLTVIQLDILDHENIAKNPENRCYFCKKALFSALKDQALADGYALLLDGTNASDDASDRPGMRALRELEVRSPLREAGLTKGQIRELSRKASLFTWDKPAYACLATRVKTGQALTADILARIEKGEDLLRKMGFSDLRLRISGESALLQLPQDQIHKATARWEAISAALAPYFPTLQLDPKGR